MKYWVLILLLLLSCSKENRRPLERWNIVLISIDTLRADALGAYGNTAPVSPTLDAIAREGALFERALSHVPLTLPSHASLLTGNLPLTHGIHDNNGFQLRSGQETLAALFHKKGYRTAAFVSSIVLDHRFGLDHGFERYDDRFAFTSGAMEPRRERSAEETTARVATWFGENRNAPFFLFVHYYDPHAPYRPPQKFAGSIGNPYWEEVQYVDKQIGLLLRSLDPVRERTILVITSDHGEGLGEHNELGHGLFLYNSTLHVPLILQGPGIPRERRMSSMVSLIDVTPTILDLAGLPAPGNMDGRSLTRLLRGEVYAERPVISETFYPLQIGWSPLFAITTRDRKFIEAPTEEFFDVYDDPAEKLNIMESNPREAQPLSEKIRKYRKAAVAARKRPVRDSELEEQLKSLGYVSGSSIQKDTQSLPDPKEKIEVWKLFERSTFLAMEGNNAEAVALLEKAIAIDPQNPILYDTIGRYLFSVNPEKAARQWRRALLLDPYNHTFHHKLAECYLKLGDRVKSLQEELLALKLEPEMTEALVGASALLVEMKKPGDALSYLERALRVDSRNYYALYQSGLAWQSLGDIVRAAQFFEQSIAANPDFPLGFYDLGILRAQTGDLAGAENYLVRAAELDPAFAEPHFNLAVIYERTGRMAQAAHAYAEFIRKAATAPHLAFRVASAHQRLRAIQ